MSWRAIAPGTLNPIVLILALSLGGVVLAGLPAQAQSGPPGGMPPGGGPPGGPPGGFRPPKPPKPLEVDELLNMVAKQHRDADIDHDGLLTMAEVRGQVDALALAAIDERFRTIDTDRNGAIDRGEFAAWQRAMGSLVLSDVAAASVSRSMIPQALPFDTGAGMKGEMMQMLVEPLNAAMVAQADANHDGGVDVGELQQYQRRRFDALDRDGDGFLTMLELPQGPPARPDGAPLPPPDGSMRPGFPEG